MFLKTNVKSKLLMSYIYRFGVGHVNGGIDYFSFEILNLLINVCLNSEVIRLTYLLLIMSMIHSSHKLLIETDALARTGPTYMRMGLYEGTEKFTLIFFS